jgi:hypothetical protein
VNVRGVHVQGKGAGRTERHLGKQLLRPRFKDRVHRAAECCVIERLWRDLPAEEKAGVDGPGELLQPVEGYLFPPKTASLDIPLTLLCESWSTEA